MLIYIYLLALWSALAIWKQSRAHLCPGRITRGIIFSAYMGAAYSWHLAGSSSCWPGTSSCWRAVAGTGLVPDSPTALSDLQISPFAITAWGQWKGWNSSPLPAAPGMHSAPSHSPRPFPVVRSEVAQGPQNKICLSCAGKASLFLYSSCKSSVSAAERVSQWVMCDAVMQQLSSRCEVFWGGGGRQKSSSFIFAEVEICMYVGLRCVCRSAGQCPASSVPNAD